MRRVVAFLAVLALGLAGCGGGDDGAGSGEDATALLKRGFASDVDSGVLTFDAQLDLKGVAGFGGPLKLELHGPFRAAPAPTEMPDLDVDFTASGAGQTFSGKVITTRENAWIEYQGETYEVGEDLWARWVESLRLQNMSQAQTLAEAGVDPLDWVEDPKTGGEEELDGTQTTKVTGTLDVGALLHDVNKLSSGDPLPESTLRDVEQAVGDVDVDAWIGDDDIWRRVRAESDFEVPEDQRSTVGGLDGGHLSLDVKLEDPNEPVQIKGPAEAHPIDQLLQQLGIPPETLLGPGYSETQPGWPAGR